MKNVLCILILLALSNPAGAQLKFVVEDFEGFTDTPSDLNSNGVFTFGNSKAFLDTKITVPQTYSGKRCITLNKNGKLNYGGWGKGIGLFMELDPGTDYLNFYVYQPATNDTNTIKIELQEDDNGDNGFKKEADDSWVYFQHLENKNSWQLVSIPLNQFKDANKGGDGIFNINYKQGKLLCFIISFINPPIVKDVVNSTENNKFWSFDFICFSKGKLPTGNEIFQAPLARQDDYCNLGAWSKEGNVANFSDIAAGFEKNFKPASEKKLGVVHFFQPFAVDGGNKQNFFPSVERINKVIQEGYIPMITLEDHFVNAKPNMKQPNLYSIIEGHFDNFFADWAKQIKQVDGVILLRILHEFNGDWYPWCTANNDKNPKLIIKAFRHICDIFKAQHVNNVRFIWCPNSMSLPQEKWNFIMDAYPGDEYVDYVGMDIYNGAGKGALWRSFRKEGIENYFILTQQLANKPLLICEIASRERKESRAPSAQNKAEWIKEMSEALKSDMSGVRLLTWFNEKESFKINSSSEAKDAFLKYVLKDDYFKSGTAYMLPMLR